MTPTLLLAHGWGFDAASLAPLAAALTEAGVPVLACEDGQLGAAPCWPVPAGPYVLAGHSAGFPALLERYGAGCRGAVALAGFTRFAAAAGFPAGVAPRLLSRMARRLEQDPGGTVDAFRSSCGAPPAPPGTRFDMTRLSAGLSALAAADVRPVLAALRARGVPVLALAAADDPVVSAAHSGSCFAPEELRWRDGGHLFPFARPADCAAAIGNMLRRAG